MSIVFRCLITTIVLSLLMTPADHPAWACYAILVGCKASADGSVLLSHLEQNGGRRILNFRQIPRLRHAPGDEVVLRRGGRLPQVEQTWSFLWSQNPGIEYSDGYLNEWGVAVVSDGCRTCEDDYDTLVKKGEIRDGGIGYMLRRLVAERARTAREGVLLAGQLVERFGYADSGRTYAIADPREAWLFAAVRGRRWVAQRVPDDMIVALPNVHIIAEIDLVDSDNFLASPDLISYAVTRGWHDPNAGEPFNFRKVYNINRADPSDPRRWRGRQLAAGCEEPWSPASPPPVGIRPKEKLTVAALARLLRFTGSPGTLSTPTTQEGAVFQLHADMPPAIGCVYWRTTAEPSTSVLTPWYVGISHTPESYYRPAEVRQQLSLAYQFDSPAGTFDFNVDSAWWKFRQLQDAVHADDARRIPIVWLAWEAFERDALAVQLQIEARAMQLWETDQQAAITLLTDHCARLAANACRHADRMADDLSGKMGEK